MSRYCSRAHSTLQRGFSLIELMIAVTLGILVVIAAGTIFLSNNQTFRATQSLARVQENSRAAFELMARDIREAGGNPCNNDIPTSNHLKLPVNAFWSRWSDGIQGFGGAQQFASPAQDFSSASAGRVSDTEAIELRTAVATGAYVTTPMTAKTSSLTVNDTAGIVNDDVVMVCDFELISIFQATTVSPTSLSHSTAANCTDGFTDKNTCIGGPTSLGAWHRYSTDALIAIPQAQRWYIGNNSRGGSSLYRTTVRGGAGATRALDTQEIVEGVTRMALTYLVSGGSQYLPATSISAAQWPSVVAVRMQLDMVGDDKIGVDGKVLSRPIYQVVTLRNHGP